MRAEDLQIGDWVRNDLGEIQQVVELREEGVMLSYNDIYQYDDIYPILLTSEILEKNGFGSHKNQFGFKSYELGKDYLLENRGDRFCLVHRMPGHKYSTFWICNCYYIHQVQHAIRLLGIDKEINL